MNRNCVKTVTIGTVGAGYAAYLHGNGYEKVCGVPVRLKTVCDVKLELAEKVRTLLAAYAPDAPAVAVLKQSPAYQKVAYLVEGAEPPVIGGLVQ